MSIISNVIRNRQVDQSVEIDGVVIKLVPFSLPEKFEMSKSFDGFRPGSDAGIARAVNNMVLKSLQKTDPSVTQEDINGLAIDQLEKLVTALLKVNGFVEPQK